MIPSMSSPDRSASASAVPSSDQTGTRPPRLRPDQVSIQGAAILRTALDRVPSIRPGVVERGRALASDPGYPPAALIRHVAAQLLDAPDLSEDAS